MEEGTQGKALAHAAQIRKAREKLRRERPVLPTDARRIMPPMRKSA